MLDRRSAKRRACATLGRSAYLAELKPVRGRCLRRTRKGVCGERWGVVRVSIDLTSRERTDRLATVECAACGHTWRRTRPPDLAHDGLQAVRIDLILPSEQRRWYARGRWHTSGSDAVTVRDATLAEYLAAVDDWRKRNGSYLAARARAAAKRAADDAASHVRTVALLEQLAAHDAERAADEAAATTREG